MIIKGVTWAIVAGVVLAASWPLSQPSIIRCRDACLGEESFMVRYSSHWQGTYCECAGGETPSAYRRASWSQ